MLYSICQRYNFESNLQRPYVQCGTNSAVFDMSKIQFWKQFTTGEGLYIIIDSCIRYVKDTILKAIYNDLPITLLVQWAVFDMSKIQFWKQFTTGRTWPEWYSCCIRYVKDTILEANSQHVYMHVCILEWNIPFYLKTNRF